MPVIQFTTNLRLDHDQLSTIARELVTTVSEVLEKPLPAVMFMHHESYMYKAGTDDVCAYLEFKYVGTATSEQKKTLCDQALSIIREVTDVDPHRVYINLIENPRENAWKYTE